MSANPGSILVVDDEHLNLDMLSRRLRRSGFAVEVAASGREALEMVRNQTFDIILLDQMMPEISGAEVLRILRLDFSAAVLPIVMVTAVAESEKVAEALEAGANDYITKPIDFKVALARIRSLLARKHAEDNLRRSEERYSLAARASQDGLWDWSLAKGDVYFSPRWKEMLGLSDQEVESTSDAWFSRILVADREAALADIERHIQGDTEVLRSNFRMLHADGSPRWMSCRGMVTRDQDGKAIRLAGSITDVTDEKTLDGLTGMPNRLRFLGDLECALASTSASIGGMASHAVLFLDLDGFKTINDSLGHLAGDQLLREIAGRLQLIVEAEGKKLPLPGRPLAARMGGDEFAILLKEAMTGKSVEDFAAQVMRSMEVPFELEGNHIRCAFSIGVALASTLHSKPEDILRDADTAMYTAKRQGRGQVAVFTEAMHEAAVQQLDLENDIRLSASRNELEIAYQPKVYLASGQTYGVEALLRWNHPKRGLLQPNTFIPIAETTGAIVDMGRWVLNHACAQVLAWHDQFPMQPPLQLSVNLSPREFKQRDLVAEISRTLIATGFPAASLHLEITEGVLFEDLTVACSTLTALKELGVSLDLDDFGTGYSSLQYLRELPFDLLKIDKYFVKGLNVAQPSSGELIQTILSMAANLGLEVVAEGIETGEHSLVLQVLGCRLGQGFYYSKPISPIAMEALLAAERAALPNVASSVVPLTDTGTIGGLACSA